MSIIENEMTGLSTSQAEELQKQYGKNQLVPEKKTSFVKQAAGTLAEPMFLLLMAAAVIYFILGEPRDGAIMLIFVVGIISIDVIQEWKTDKTLNALKDLSAPHIDVIRDGDEKTIASCDLVPGDLMLICEGIKIPADGTVIRCNDLRVDESSLTGEPEGVWKRHSEINDDQGDYWRKDRCYAGTLVTQGMGIIKVDEIGAKTEYGKIGLGVAETPQEKTPLQKQTGTLVKTCAIIALGLCILVFAVTWMDISNHSFSDRLVESILSGVTLAMAMIPEEFPVILTVFLSMGAWRLAKKQSLVRRLPGVETLGEISVLCVDKTGTITMNQMMVEDTLAYKGDERKLCSIMGMACETDAYDPMEHAMLDFCETIGISKDNLFNGQLLTEYPFTNELKMMGHVWKREDEIVIAAKGSLEQIIKLCDIDDAEKLKIRDAGIAMAKRGLRVIAVAEQRPDEAADIPVELTDCHLQLCGLVGLADPPRESVKDDIETFVKAGIRVVMITGDNGITASAIADRVGIPDCNNIITGDMLSTMSDEEMAEAVKTVSIFSRVLPEHKMRIVKAFKENGEIVAMTGDGVNDAPALKHADIGIAMGKRGSEVSREAADLILLDDNFTTIVETVRDGRRIFDNIRKAIGYVFAIHIPIAFSSLLAPIFGISQTAFMFLPLHVVLLELVIDPTCSIVLERQPAEKDVMDRPPRGPSERLLNSSLLIKSVIQGLAVFAGAFGTYCYYIFTAGEASAPLARSAGLTVLILSNFFLVLVNSSEREYAFKSARKLIKDKVMWAVTVGTIAMVAVILYSPLSILLKMTALPAWMLGLCLLTAAVCVLWYEIVKVIMKKVKFICK